VAVEGTSPRRLIHLAQVPFRSQTPGVRQPPQRPSGKQAAARQPSAPEAQWSRVHGHQTRGKVLLNSSAGAARPPEPTAGQQRKPRRAEQPEIDQGKYPQRSSNAHRAALIRRGAYWPLALPSPACRMARRVAADRPASAAHSVARNRRRGNTQWSVLAAVSTINERDARAGTVFEGRIWSVVLGAGRVVWISAWAANRRRFRHCVIPPRGNRLGA
jgi:hypothetical protein